MNIYKEKIKKITKTIYSDCIKGLKYFKVHRNKSTKEMV